MAGSFYGGGFAPKRASPDQLLPYCKRISANVKHPSVSYTYAFYSTKKSTVILSKLRWTYGGEGGIRTLAPVTPAYSLSRGAPYSHLGTSPQDAIVGERCWRREWDSNPRCFSASPVFKTGSLNRSDISPYVHLGQYSKIPTACQPTGANRCGRGAVPFPHCSGASRPPPGASSGAPLWNRRGKNERSA